MNKEQIIGKLNSFLYGKDSYWVITGAAMVLYGIREQTHDIDLGCTSQLADLLEEQGFLYKYMDDGGRWFKIGEDIEVFENWIEDEIVFLDEIPVLSLKGLVEMKRKLGREKDLRDISLIREYLGKSG